MAGSTSTYSIFYTESVCDDVIEKFNEIFSLPSSQMERWSYKNKVVDENKWWCKNPDITINGVSPSQALDAISSIVSEDSEYEVVNQLGINWTVSV